MQHRRYGLLVLCFVSLLAGAAEWNPVRQEPLSIGPQSHRLIVGFRATPANQVEHLIKTRRQAEGIRIVQASTTDADVQALAQRTGIAVAKSRQLTPSMHVLFLPKTLYGADVDAALTQLRADPAVAFADVDARRYALAGAGPDTPNDPLYQPTPLVSPPASGQWYLNAPGGTFVLESNTTQDFSATDAVDAWNITTGSTGIVIADVDTGVRFDHPDLLRAGAASLGSGFGGRLLPGYDFVGEDYNPNSPYGPLGTFDIANDGDGWDPDPSDPGDWITAADVSNSNDLFSGDMVASSSWHGTRVVGVYGALTNNDVGVAGMSWGPWILPVRGLGKGGGYDSDILSGIQWAAGMTLSGVPDNPYPADIINLSLGGNTSACDASSTYGNPTMGLPAITHMGVLVVVAAGNGGTPGQTAPVETPANCSATVSGVVAVAGLRNVGTKVGYSSFGPEVTIAAPAGNCIQTSGDCLRSIDTTTNAGAMGPGADTYTNEQNPNLGTSFATPIVSGIAALMRSANANLTPAQLVTRLKASASAFPANTGNVPVCPNNDPTSGECSCLGSSPAQCGAGMVNALSAVRAAQAPIGVIVIPETVSAGSILDASASLPGCNASAVPAAPLSISSYLWTTPTSGLITGGANTSKVTVGGGTGTLTLAITDSAGNVDTETVTLVSGTATSTAPSSVTGTAASACPTSLAVNPAAPTITASFAPASVAPNATSTLTITFSNTNGFALTQSSYNTTLPNGLTIKTSGQPAAPETATSCTGAAMALNSTTTTIALSGANIPASGSCTITATVLSASAGTFMSSSAANALMTAPAGGNAAAASASLSVNAPSGGGGGMLGWSELLIAAGLVGVCRRRARRTAPATRSDSCVE